MHFFYNVLHNLDRARAARHNAGTHVGKVRLIKVLVPEHCDKHRRHAVKCRDFFFINARERATR